MGLKMLRLPAGYLRLPLFCAGIVCGIDLMRPEVAAVETHLLTFLAAVALVWGIIAANTKAGRLSVCLMDLYAMTPAGFERHVAETFTTLGYRVEHFGGPGDRGADLIATRGTEKIAIQCKRYRQNVPVAAIQEVYTAKDLFQCTRALVISTSDFTLPAQKMASDLKVDLTAGIQYVKIVNGLPTAQWSKKKRLTLIPCRPFLEISVILTILLYLSAIFAERHPV